MDLTLARSSVPLLAKLSREQGEGRYYENGTYAQIRKYVVLEGGDTHPLIECEK